MALIDYGIIRNERERLMLIQVSEKRWLAEPEAVYWGKPDECWCNHMKDSAVHVESSSSFAHKWGSEYENQWVARMPSGTLEWLSDEEYERLIDAAHTKEISPMRANSPEVAILLDRLQGSLRPGLVGKGTLARVMRSGYPTLEDLAEADVCDLLQLNNIGIVVARELSSAAKTVYKEN